MTFIRTIAWAVLASVAAAGTAQAAVVVTFEGEAAGVQNTTATFTASAVENFNSLPVHTYPSSITQTTATGGGSITMNYTAGSSSGIQINSADQYGAAGGTGNYIVAFNSTPYTLNLSSTNVAGGINYFGYWLSALDAGNEALFYGNNNQLLLTFKAQDLISYLNTLPNPSEYYGNPNTAFKGQDSGEPFVFLNFFDTTGTFSKVVFEELPSYGGGYESDNHTVGNYATMGQGTTLPLVASVQSAVPEPASWLMLLAGFGVIGIALRARPASTRAPALALNMLRC
jgi:hypothetical protein